MSAHDDFDAASTARDMYEAFNGPSVDEVIAYFADDATYEDPLGVAHFGKSGVRAALASGMSGTQTYQVSRLFAYGHEVVATWVLEIGQGPARVALTGMDILTFRNGLVHRKQCFMKAKELLMRPLPVL